MVIGQFYPSIGGAENQCKLLCEHLCEKGVDVDVVTVHRRGQNPLDRHNGFKVIRLAKFSFGKLKVFQSMFLLGFFILLNRNKYDFVHVHGVSFLAFAAVLSARIVNVPSAVKVLNSGKRFDFFLHHERTNFASFFNFFIIKYALAL